MTEQQSNGADQRPPELRSPLDYAHSQAPATASVRVGQVMAGAVAATVLFLGFGFGVPFLIGEGGMVVGPLVGIIVLVPLALRIRRNPRFRPWAVGIWIGLGIGLLLDGACWAFMVGMEH